MLSLASVLSWYFYGYLFILKSQQTLESFPFTCPTLLLIHPLPVIVSSLVFSQPFTHDFWNLTTLM